MYIESWKKIYEGMKNKTYFCFLVTSCFDVNLGKIKINPYINYMNDLIIVIEDENKTKILEFNTLDTDTIDIDKKPFLKGLFEENNTILETYCRIRFPKFGMSLHLKKCK